MKSYDELTLEEKIELVQNAIEDWKNGNDPYYANLTEEHCVALFMLLRYNMRYENIVYPPINIPAHQQQDVVNIVKLLGFPTPLNNRK